MATICLVNGVFPPDMYGGAENYVLRVADRLRDRGHDAFVLTSTPYEGMESFGIHRDDNNNIPVYRFYPFNISHRSSGTGNNVVTKALWHQLDSVNPHAKRVTSQFLAERDPDVVHTNNFMGIGASVGAAIAESDARYVHTLHDYSLICPKSNLLRDRTAPADELVVCDSPPAPCRLYSRVKRYSIGEPDLVIGPSQHVIDIHRDHGFFEGEESIRIQHGIEQWASSIPDTTSKSVLYVGKHLRSKGLETLFEAAREVPDVTIHLCGTGPFDEQSEKTGNKLENVKYHGFVSDKRLKKLRRNAAAAVVPSIWMENSPLTIYESFAQGLPVIGADIGGIPELVDESRGWLFEPGNTSSLVEKIRTAVTEEQISRRRNALSWASEHNMSRHIDQLEQVYAIGAK